MVSGKVNKSECGLMHGNLKDAITDIKGDTKVVREDIQEIKISLARLNGKNKT